MTPPSAPKGLPEWISPPHEQCSPMCSGCKQSEALSIAWEALERIDRKMSISRDPHDSIQGLVGRFQNTRTVTRDAIRRIASLGNTQQDKELGK